MDVEEPSVDTSGPPAPDDLRAGGMALWLSIAADHPGLTLTEAQKVQLHEACRAKDSLDRMAALTNGDVDTWMRLVPDPNSDTSYDLRITSLVQRTNETRNVMKQLLAAMRLPDPSTGRVPQYRGPRGAQAPTVPGGAPKAPTSLERARARREANGSA